MLDSQHLDAEFPFSLKEQIEERKAPERKGENVHERERVSANAAALRQPYAINWSAGLVAGIVGTGAMTLVILYFLPSSLMISFPDIGTLLGTLLASQPGPTAARSGLAWHFGNGIVLTYVYAGVLRGLQRQSNWGTGIWYGLVLWFIGPMLLLPVLMSIHPLVQEGQIQNPGIFMLDAGRGWVPAFFSLGAHLVFGFVVGVVYEHRYARVRKTLYSPSLKQA